MLAAGASQWTLCVRLTSVQGSLSIVHAHPVPKNTLLLRYSLKTVLLQKPLKILGAWRARPTLIRDTTPNIACSMALVRVMVASPSLLLLPTPWTSQEAESERVRRLGRGRSSSVCFGAVYLSCVNLGRSHKAALRLGFFISKWMSSQRSGRLKNDTRLLHPWCRIRIVADTH